MTALANAARPSGLRQLAGTGTCKVAHHGCGVRHAEVERGHSRLNFLAAMQYCCVAAVRHVQSILQLRTCWPKGIIRLLYWGGRAANSRSAQQTEIDPANLIRAHWILVRIAFLILLACSNSCALSDSCYRAHGLNLDPEARQRNEPNEHER